MNYLQIGAQVLQDRMEQYGGLTVEYRRPGEFAFPICMVPGRNPTEITDVNGTLLRGQVQDFIVDICKLRNQMSDPKKPLRGDEIVANWADGQRIVYIVNGEDIATSHYEPADSYGVAWRIHTKTDRIVS